ncbi:MAG: lytic transglycosylase domain-containing protein, partial [Nitrospirales bacterium]
IANLRNMASELFYSTKTMELELAQLEDMVLQELGPTQVEKILKRKKKLEEARQRTAQEYEKFLEDIGVYSPNMSKQDRIILRMARLFGESEVEMPKAFVQEVKKYISKWQSTPTLGKAIARANRNHYGHKVSQAMLAEHMTPQFFYLGLKESEFNLKSVGPKTRFGIAKGPWQFIPTTAVEYGLKTGPLVDIERYDPRDDRHKFQLATRAAAKYLRYLYTTEAQASGLLVMASYNWGPTRVKNLIRKLPPNPKDRNFWQLIKQFKVPEQTKDYVFYIFSAAVIGQDPKLFGFEFMPPLPESFPSALIKKRSVNLEP